MSETLRKLALGVLTVGGVLLAAFPLGKRQRRLYVPDPRVLPDAISHLVYEYSNLMHSSEYICRPDNSGGPICVHVADVFLLNCRKLGDFFNTRPTEKPDVRAAHFCTKDPMPPQAMHHYRNWKAALDQNLAHISYKRVTNPIVFFDGVNDSVRVKALTEEMRTAFRLFLDHLDDEYKLAFATALKDRRAYVGNIPLP